MARIDQGMATQLNRLLLLWKPLACLLLAFVTPKLALDPQAVMRKRGCVS